MFFLTLIAVLLTALLSYIFLLDLRHKIIWNWSNGLLFILGLFVLLFLALNESVPSIHFNTGVSSFIMFSIMSVALFYILGNENWGGGDAKMMMASSVFFITFEGLLLYVGLLFLGSLSHTLYAFFKNRKMSEEQKIRSLPFGPVLGSSLLGSFGLSLVILNQFDARIIILSIALFLIPFFVTLLAKTLFKEKFENWQVEIPEDAI